MLLLFIPPFIYTLLIPPGTTWRDERFLHAKM
jgi:hypothetical protein